MASGRTTPKTPAKTPARTPARGSAPGRPGTKGGPTPQQKVATMRRKAARSQRRRRFLVVGLIAVLVLGGGAAVAVYYGTRDNPLANVKTFTNTRNHTTAAVTYKQNPPVGGDHDPTWLNCGIYGQPVRNENAVHDLEHGAVWITYRPDLPQTEIDKLVSLVRGQTYETLSPYPGLPAPVVISAWDTQLRLTGPDDPGLQAFIDKYKLGPQTPEPGASCTGGTGTPVT